MVLTVLDSGGFPASERSAGFRAAVAEVLPSPTRLEAGHDVTGVMRHWSIVEGMTLMRLDVITSGMTLARRPRSEILDAGPERLSLAVAPIGSCVTRARGVRLDAPHALRLIDLSAGEYDIVYRGRCRSMSFEIDCASLGVRVDDVRLAMASVAASPLHGLARRQLIGLVATAERLGPEAIREVGSSTAHLVAALVQSVSTRERTRRAAFARTLLARVEDYVERHLSDRDLTPSRVAAVHGVSLRTLYTLFADRAETPGEWIAKRRLTGAVRDLERSAETVSAVAQRWGFADHSHFDRRFRAEHGMTPTEYRRSLRSGDAEP